MHHNERLHDERLERVLRERLLPAVYRARHPLEVAGWSADAAVTDPPVPFDEAVRQTFSPSGPGAGWGAPWGTTWLHITGDVPAEWTGVPGTEPEVVIDLGFTAAIPGFQAEGLVYAADGMVIKGLQSRNRWVPVRAGTPADDGTSPAAVATSPGGLIDLYVEAASNPDLVHDFGFAPTALGDPATLGPGPLYTLGRVDVTLRDLTVWNLVQDIRALDGLQGELPAASTRRAQLRAGLERCLDRLDPDDVADTAAAARAELAPLLDHPASTSAHHVHAVGHAHIDSAWLWPLRETPRKVARTLANVLALGEENPDFHFAMSSAQQFAWVKEHDPRLFERVRAAVAAGIIVPVGGMWVESDTNLPGGEALVRQFVAGQRFFRAEFGLEPGEVWLPDSFGYSAAFPQIARLAGMRWFLTQKLSWSDTNVFPHHTFLWEGIDGSRIFTHFPPVADYNAELTAAELARAERLFAEKAHATVSLVPFGWGDGGGGPTREMLAAARRSRDLEGSPTVELSTPQRFFQAAEAEHPSPPVWSGELYLEFHRGTYTSQARTKRGNRRSEHLLREAELWAATAAVRTGAPYPYDVLERAWQSVLLLQFHDILPGTSIAWVHQEAERRHAHTAHALTGVIDEAVRAIAGVGVRRLRLNAGPYAADGVPALGADADGALAQPGYAAALIERTAAGIVLRNDRLAVTIDADGLISSLRDVLAGRELIPAGSRGNLLQLHRDTPTRWDAWDIDASHRRTVTNLTAADTVEVSVQSDELVGVRVVRTFGRSRVEQHLILRAGSPTLDLRLVIDWHERQKLLRLVFPLDVLAERAASEIQFGHVFRPTHANTTWDAARFETVAHRWVHVGEPGYGVAVANDSTYGHAIDRTLPVDPSGAPSVVAGADRTGTTVRLSLLRAPLYPDPGADQGRHELRVSVRPGAGIADAVAEGYRLNLPVRTVTGVAASSIEPLLRVDNPAVVVEAIKLAEDHSGDLIVRLYEAHGNRSTARLIRHFEATDVVETDLLERPLAAPRADLAAGRPPAEESAVPGPTEASRELVLTLRPFEIVTLRFRRP
ncbi:glycoside hydrolase family 38 C-terminal domain-containing protein [Cryobacterium sp. SO2]|uniref:alpha-mannosidase n=1 Tax=Cryobacterium sp. SO2 TaxID=1897060 RepID=UPI00223DC497|nr:glycoside hydrolase family 38 C-terminal domain-containing protein [Cryobacterium sp. SO2]WEO78077.1 glycoside hydrolase family 38 C-terminal domain-containing protein [Cryobacterium sp. SO2]